MKKLDLLKNKKMALLIGLSLPLNHVAAEFIGLEEVVVTASKRAESLQDAPLSITAMSSQQLDEMGVNDFIDYAVRIPNLGFSFESDGRFDSRKIGIRGVFGAASSSIGGTTGFYIDDTPVPETMNPLVIDVERVEVLRGPQGSLYGARSMGGTVRMISKQAHFEGFEGTVRGGVSSVTDGDLNWTTDIALNVPVSDTVAMRVQAYTGGNSGIYDRVSEPEGSFSKDDVDDEEFMGYQVSAVWKATDKLTISPRFMYQEQEADGLPYADFEPDNTLQRRAFNIDEPGSDEWYLASLTTTYDADYGTYTTSLAVFDRSIEESEDSSEWVADTFETPLLPAPIEQTVDFKAKVIESRFTSDFDGAIQMTLGVFYQDTEQNLIYPPWIVDGLDDAADGTLGTDNIYSQDQDFDTEEIAAFGEISYDINEWLTATIGGRWSDTEVFSSDATDGIAVGGPTFTSGSQQESKFLPKFLLDAVINDNVNVYGTVSQGFRIGGVNSPVPEAFCADDLDELGISGSDDILSYDSDEVTNYEIGVKSTLADNRVTLNVSGFFVEWTDIQQKNLLACGFQLTTNAGKAENKGLEIEFAAAPTDQFSMNLGIGYTDAKIVDAGNTASGISEGDRVQGVPEWNATLSGQYTFPINDLLEGVVRADYAYYGDSYSANNEPTEPRLRDDWDSLNLRLGVTSDRWDATLYVNNVTDERANLADNRSIAVEMPGRPRIVTNRPRTVGIEARYSF